MTPESSPEPEPEPEPEQEPQLVCLRGGGTGLVLDVSGPLLPRVLHWGADLGAPQDGGLVGLAAASAPPVPGSALDEPWPLTLLPVQDDGWSGAPGVAGHRAGTRSGLRLRLVDAPVATAAPDGGSSLVCRAADDDAGLEVRVELALDAHGVLRVTASATATTLPASDPDPAAGSYDLAALRVLLPLPPRAGEVLDLTGRWCRESSPQRSRLQHGTHLRASRRGRTGHDTPLLLCAGTPGFGFGTGEVWAAHVAFSGDSEHLVEALPEGAGGHAAVLGGGEHLRPGEVRLAPGETYTAPAVVLVWSDAGLDGLSRRLHAGLRDRPGHPRSPRPLVLNSWEAVYFSTDTDHLVALADAAADLGVERFVLDDGWFGARRDDTRALGDWVVAAEVWPRGLRPLVEHVHGLGLQFGLWVEPEMVNPDSDLARAHPDWILGAQGGAEGGRGDGGGLPREWRHQQVLDVADPRVSAHLLERLDALVTENSVDYLKWDHNRDLHRAVGPDGEPRVHAQTLAVYALLDELRRRHPSLEVESCASGGARVDLGILQRTDRVWTSDNNDALERASIQRWTSLLVPLELMGAHVGPPVAHTTHRALDLSLRCAVALFGHAGLEWDVTTCTPAETEQLRAWAGLYKELRPLLHTGDLVRGDPAVHGPGSGDDALLQGVVARDRGRAAYSWVRLATSVQAVPGALVLPGLDPARRYRVRVRTECGPVAVAQAAPPGWWAAAHDPAGLEVSGAVLTRAGLQAPVLAPAQALVLDVTATGAG